MLLRIPASKDTFITNKLVNGRAVSSSNAGASEILQLFATVAPATTGNILIAFPTASALAAYSSSYATGTIQWDLFLQNVETENPNIGSFDVAVHPLEIDWDEGKGQDLDYWTDKGTANWVYARNTATWATPGAKPVAPTYSASMHFDSGHENLFADITSFIGNMPYGLWVGLTASNGTDMYLKAFRSRQTHFPRYQPYLEARWNDFTGSFNSGFVDIVDATGTLVGGIYNLRSVYDTMESPILRVHLRPKDWNLSVITTASSDVSGTVLTNAYYRVIDNFTDEVLIPFGTGTTQHTRMSYNDAGNYFKFPMQNLVPGSSYRFEIGYYDIEGTWNVLPDDTTFRVK